METNTQTEPAKVLLQWKAPIHPHFERTKVWYVAAGMVAVVSLIMALFLQIWTLAIVIVLACIVYLMVHTTIVMKEIALREDGYTLDGKLTEWDQCAGFWILQFNRYDELHIGHTQKRKEDTVIQLGDRTPQDIRTAMEAHLRELPDKQEKLIDIFIRICKL